MGLKLLIAALALATFVTASAVSISESPNYSTIDTRQSSATISFGVGKATLRINNSSIRINIGDGPVKHINRKCGSGSIDRTSISGTADGLANPAYLTVKDVSPVISFFTGPTLGQVWYEKHAANVDAYPVHQITDVKSPTTPEFGGLAIDRAKNLPDNSGVYFGKQAPRALGMPIRSNTSLNMANARRTVWYADDNPIGRTRGPIMATYDVVDINKHTPGADDFYRDTVTAKFGATTQGTMSIQIARGADRVSFDKTKINSTKGTSADIVQGMKGQFHDKGAAAIADIVTHKVGAAGDVVFDGYKR